MLEAEGEPKFRSIVAEVKAMAEAVEYCKLFTITGSLRVQTLNTKTSEVVVVLRTLHEKVRKSLRDK